MYDHPEPSDNAPDYYPDPKPKSYPDPLQLNNYVYPIAPKHYVQESSDNISGYYPEPESNLYPDIPQLNDNMYTTAPENHVHAPNTINAAPEMMQEGMITASNV